ncbi:MAG: hypothetical protein MPJ78_20395 [Hyphomicrobiaceae bacterium]|nr:hypothetical protein [Hyphomicrobiaceae bacterium]
MAKPVTLTFATYNYDRMRPILDGRVSVEGCKIAPVVLTSEDLFPRVVQRAEFDVCEMSMSSYLIQVAAGTSQYTAVPAFASRSFRHDCIYVNAASNISDPEDLQGKRVGLPEYQATMCMWVRGILQDDYGVDFRTLKYRTGGINVAGRKERLPLSLPEEIEVVSIGEDQTLDEMLVTGELDAVIAPQMLKSFAAGDPRVRRLFPDPVKAAKAWHKRTGYFPIMHVIGIRSALLEAHPGLARRLFAALVDARNAGYDELQRIAEYGSSTFMLPFFAAGLAEIRDMMGENWWSYGVEQNRRELETILRYSHEQFLSKRRLTVDDIFASETLDMAG